jgi:3-hydroxy-9,10-secoandrosta-1,3,5(10)-triene-9,17-dione monooxygenase
MGMDREDLIEAARALVPALRERAEDTEAARRIPDTTHAAFVDAGLYRMFQPERFGGGEMDLALMVDVAMEIGRGCGSSAWNLTNIAVQGWIGGMHYPETQEELWADNPAALIASSFPGPGSSVRRVDGGLLVDGTFNFASGVLVADWNNLQIFLPREDGPPEHYFALVPKSDYEIVDDWFVTGLAGTASQSIKMNEVFIPEHRALFTSKIRGGGSPGSAVNPSVLYKLPVFSVGLKHFSGTAVGIAKGAIELIEEDMKSRVTVTGIKLVDQQSVHLRIAESAAEVDAAWARLTRDCDDATRIYAAGDEPGIDQRLGWRRNDAFAGQLAVNAVERLYSLTGGRGLSGKSPFQRAWRDVHAAVQQMLMSWDMHGTNYGRVRLGHSFNDPRI